MPLLGTSVGICGICAHLLPNSAETNEVFSTEEDQRTTQRAQVQSGIKFVIHRISLPYLAKTSVLGLQSGTVETAHDLPRAGGGMVPNMCAGQL